MISYYMITVLRQEEGTSFLVTGRMEEGMYSRRKESMSLVDGI